MTSIKYGLGRDPTPARFRGHVSAQSGQPESLAGTPRRAGGFRLPQKHYCPGDPPELEYGLDPTLRELS
jgi:hypothetical protein